MSISRRLQVGTVLSLGVALGVGLVLLGAMRDLERSVRRDRLVAAALHGVLDLTMVTNDYVKHREERPRQQWLQKHASLGKNLSDPALRSAADAASLSRLRHEHEALATLFAELVSSHRQSASGRQNAEFYAELEERLLGQLAVRSQNLESETLKLAEANSARMLANQRRASLLVGLFALLMGIVVALNSLWIGRAVVKPIMWLRRGVETVAAGDLDHRVGVVSGDEIGDLSAAFNRMTGQLKVSYAALEDGLRAREEAEAAARREAEFSSAVLGTLGALVVVLDTAGRIVRFNRTCEAVTRYGFAEVEGQPFWDLFTTPEETPGVRAMFGQLTTGQFPNQHENHWLTREGGRRLIAWSNTCLVNEQGEVEHVITTGVDITEQRAAEENLRLDEMRLKALLELSEMTQASLQEITDFALEEAVRLTRSTIGYQAFMNEDETVLTMHSWSKTAMQQCSIIDKPIIYAVVDTGLWGEAVRRRQPVVTNDYEAPNPLKKDYPEGRVEVKRHLNIPVFDGERIVAVAGVGNKEEPYDDSDVLQLRLLMDGMWRLLHRKQAAEDLQRAHDELEMRVASRTAELARSNAELEQFAYVASHHLQEPLRKIQTFGDRLFAKSAGELSPASADYLERMQNASRRMSDLINDLLTYSRVTTKARPFVSVSLDAIAAAVLSDLEISIQEAGATVDVGPLPELEADPTQMCQLLQNLIVNGLKFHRPDVSPVVTVRGCLLDREDPKGEATSGGRTMCQITVTDNGIGFEPRFAERIFGLFQRLHERGQYDGTGIGLALCLKIAEHHGGSITASSQLEGGAGFTVTLPVAHQEGETEE